MFTTLLFLAVVAFVAGAVNALAGGGTFLTFPSLTGVARLGEKAANVTSCVGVWPGYAASVLAARRDLAALGGRAVAVYTLVGLAGGLVGAVLLLTTPARAFTFAVPWLLGAGTALFALGPAVQRWAGRERASGAPPERRGPSLAVVAAVLPVAVYNGYFGAGGGVLLLAGLALALPGDVRRMNVVKVLLQVTANAAAVLVFVSHGVEWRFVGPLAVGSMLGGFAGMRVASRVPRGALRALVLAVGAGLTAVYFARVYG